MKPTHIEHLGIAVKNLDESIKYYEEVLGLECYNIEEVKDQKVRTAFFKLVFALICVPSIKMASSDKYPALFIFRQTAARRFSVGRILHKKTEIRFFSADILSVNP